MSWSFECSQSKVDFFKLSDSYSLQRTLALTNWHLIKLATSFVLASLLRVDDNEAWSKYMNNYH